MCDSIRWFKCKLKPPKNELCESEKVSNKREVDAEMDANPAEQTDSVQKLLEKSP